MKKEWRKDFFFFNWNLFRGLHSYRTQEGLISMQLLDPCFPLGLGIALHTIPLQNEKLNNEQK